MMTRSNHNVLTRVASFLFTKSPHPTKGLELDSSSDCASSLLEEKLQTHAHKTPLQDFFLEPRISRGDLSLPLQIQSRKLLKYLIMIPLSTVVSMLYFVYFLVPFFRKQGLIEFTEHFLIDGILKNRIATLLLVVFPIAVSIVFDVLMESWTMIMLKRGRRRRHLPKSMPRLIHAVIVCNYKEPIEVLEATIDSIACNTLAESTVVILACEDRDANADAVFGKLAFDYQQCFRNFFKTTHTLAKNEIAGKSSNENHACRELHKFVIEEGLDPFQVMVTTCDADSLFDTVFLEQVEAEFARMPDGRRFIYNSPINTYRNLPQCNPIVRLFEVKRCQYDLFKGVSFRPAQSNYSLTLGFAKEINYWDPSNTSEDLHTTLKAMATTGKGASVVVNVWSLILNDSVCSFKDRWVQAKRHMWGIEEVAFVTSLFPVVRIGLWVELLARTASQMFQSCTPSLLWLLFGPVRHTFFALRVETQQLLVFYSVASALYSWAKVVIRETFLYRRILSGRKLMMRRSFGEWLQLILLWPLLSEIGSFVFVTAATWRVLVHAITHETLVYVTAPKSLTCSIDSASGEEQNDPGETKETKPKKSV